MIASLARDFAPYDHGHAAQHCPKCNWMDLLVLVIEILIRASSSSSRLAPPPMWNWFRVISDIVNVKTEDTSMTVKVIVHCCSIVVIAVRRNPVDDSNIKPPVHHDGSHPPSAWAHVLFPFQMISHTIIATKGYNKSFASISSKHLFGHKYSWRTLTG